MRWASNGARVAGRRWATVGPAERQVGHEPGVHHVEVDPVGAGLHHAADLPGQVREVGVEDARGDAGASLGHQRAFRRGVGRSPGRRGRSAGRGPPGSAGRGSRPSRPIRRPGGDDQPAPEPTHGAGSQACAALPCRRRAAAARCSARREGQPRTRPPAAPADARPPAPGVSPPCSAASWPHAAPTSWPRLRRIVTPIPTARRRPANASIRSGLLGPHGVWATGFIGMQVDVSARAAQQCRDGRGVGRGVVDPVDHHVLVADASARRLRVVAGGGHDLGHRPAPVERHEQVAQRIAGRVEADGERPLGPQPRQALDPGHDARGGDREVAGAQPEALGIRERGDRREHRIQVEQRLAHAHEHDVREVASVARQPPPRVARLVDDLGDLEVALEAELTRGAERAADRAAGLAAQAQGRPLASARTRPDSA